MTAAECVRCGRPMPDAAYACAGCAAELAEKLSTAAGHAEDAEAVIARQTRYGAGARGGSSDGLTPNPARQAQWVRITEAIGGWADIVVEETGRRPKWRPYLGPLCAPARPGDEDRESNRCDHDSCGSARRREAPTTLGLDTAWLAQPRQIEFLRKHPAADEALATLHKACDDLAWFVDRPADKQLVGMCDCGKVLYAGDGRSFVRCPVATCKLLWNVEASRDILRRHLGDKLVTLPEAARLAAYLDSDRTQDTIRKLLSPRIAQLVPHGQLPPGEDEDEEALTYRFGDVVALLAGIPKRVRRERREAAEMGA